MSSTKVKDRLGRHLDFYETPANVVNGLLDIGFFSGRTFLEPSAGRGSIINSVLARFPSITTTAIEIQDEFRESLLKIKVEVIIDDFLLVEPRPFDRIIANPPFSQALEFIQHAWKFLSKTGKMAFLLRLPFAASVKRHALFQELRPSQVMVLSQRPKFGGDNIDSCDYAWFVWEKPLATKTELLWIAPS